LHPRPRMKKVGPTPSSRESTPVCHVKRQVERLKLQAVSVNSPFLSASSIDELPPVPCEQPTAKGRAALAQRAGWERRCFYASRSRTDSWATLHPTMQGSLFSA